MDKEKHLFALKLLNAPIAAKVRMIEYLRKNFKDDKASMDMANKLEVLVEHDKQVN